MKKHAVVAGGAGFIGSHLTKRLLKLGYKVTVIDSLITGDIGNLAKEVGHPGLTIEIEDIRYCSMTGLNKVDLVFNLACPASPKDYQEYPIHTLETCSVGTQVLLDLAAKNKARYIHASTSEVYGNPLEHPQKETYFGNVNPYGPRACYDEGKRYAEALIYSYHHEYGVNTGIARIFNTYGPGMRVGDGRVVSNFIQQALVGEPLTIYGRGGQTRSFCYIDDMVDGLLLLAKSREESPINLGNPAEFTIVELARMVLKITGSTSDTTFQPLPVDDPVQRKPDISKAKELLGFEPKVNLAEGIKLMIEEKEL